MLVTDNVFDYSFKVNWFDVGDKRCIWLWFQDWLIWCWWQTMCLPMVSIKVNWFDVGDRQCAWLWCQCWLIWCWWQPICLNVVSSTSRVDHRDAPWHIYIYIFCEWSNVFNRAPCARRLPSLLLAGCSVALKKKATSGMTTRICFRWGMLQLDELSSW